jgi:hypothetical protein
LERYGKKRSYQSIPLMRCSDIRAELPCVDSGICQYEGIIPYPDFDIAVLGGIEGGVYRSYIDQLYLRKHLNWLHNELYKSRDSQFLPVLENGMTSTLIYHFITGSKLNTLNKAVANHRTADVLQDSFPTFGASCMGHQDQPSLNQLQLSVKNIRAGFDRAVEAFEVNLSFFQRICGALSGHEHSPPATDLLTARLRAKFYGAQVITYRPYVQQILELSSPSTVLSDRSGGAAYASEMSSFVDVEAFVRTSQFHKYMQYAERGIRALINSTKAFHGLGSGRLIVTNVWGTAHAYVPFVPSYPALFVLPHVKANVTPSKPMGQPSRSPSRILRPPTQPPNQRQGASIPPHQNAGVPKHACTAELVSGSGYQDSGVCGSADRPPAFELQI